MNEETIFAAALQKKTPAERQAYLDDACVGNAGLRAAVEELLNADSNAGSFLDRPPAAMGATDVSKSSSCDTVNSGTWAIRLPFLEPCDKPGRIGKLVSKAGEYEIIEMVGQGGMGVVLRAFDTKLCRVVAVKVMSPTLAANPSAVRRFLREATTAAAVHHEHVVTIHAVDDTHQPPYLVMEFIEGQTLQQKIEREGALELKQILRIGSQMAAGLAAAHKTGLIHRDVKPANILLENGVERVKITDFGLARAADDIQITQTGLIAGTPQYMSPEQAKGEPIDARSDLFSLGSVLYTMCTGRPAFRADSTVAVLRRVCDDAPRPIHEVNAEIPHWLCEIVNKLLEKQPEHRFHSAQEFADLLAKHLAHLQQPASCPLPSPIETRPQHGTSAAAESIKAESRYFWATGIMSVVSAGLVLGGLEKLGRAMPSPLVTWLFAGGLLSLPVGLLIMYAAWRVESRQSRGWAVTAAVLSLLPLNPFLIFCLPITIWSLATLWRAGAALDAPRSSAPNAIPSVQESDQPDVRRPPVWIWGGGLLFAVAAMFVSFLRVMFSFDPRVIAPTYIGLMFVWIIMMAYWLLSTSLRQSMRRAVFGDAPHKPTTRGVFIEHPVLGLVAIFMLMISMAVATYVLTRSGYRRLARLPAERRESAALDRPKSPFPEYIRPESQTEWTVPEKPDPARILNEAMLDLQARRYELSLAKLAWYHENALDYQPSQSGVRHTSAMQRWAKLADVYPPALARLKAFRDQAESDVKEGRNIRDAFHDSVAINRALHEESKTKDLFELLHAQNPDAARRVFSLAQPALVRTKAYTLCADYLEPEASLQRMISVFQTSKRLGNDNRSGNFQGVGEQSFTNKVATLVALLVVNGRKAEADRVAEQAKREWASAQFRAKLDDALRGNVPEPWPALFP